jgi:hypothetical protein
LPELVLGEIEPGRITGSKGIAERGAVLRDFGFALDLAGIKRVFKPESYRRLGDGLHVHKKVWSCD